jgi:hypothetical protein
MARNDHILLKPDSGDEKTYSALVDKALKAKRKIETGFIELAESIFDIHRKKLYRLKYKTFAQFCDEELGFSRQTIYVYISILSLINKYPKLISKEKAISFGHKKMRHITEGINAIDKAKLNEDVSETKKQEIFTVIEPEMASTEIEAIIEDIIQDI